MGFRQVPHFIIAVKGEAGNSSSILRATIELDIFNRLVRSGQVGTYGDVYIVNREGVLIKPAPASKDSSSANPIWTRSVSGKAPPSSKGSSR